MKEKAFKIKVLKVKAFESFLDVKFQKSFSFYQLVSYFRVKAPKKLFFHSLKSFSKPLMSKALFEPWFA